MDKLTLEKANKLNDRIENLSKMQRDLSPQFCSGVAFAKMSNRNGNFNDNNYHYHLWATTPDSTEDNAVIMRHAIKSMYDKVCMLLEEAESDLKALK